MNTLCTPVHLLLPHPQRSILPPPTQFHPIPKTSLHLKCRRRPISCCAAAHRDRDIDMAKNKHGIWSAKPQKVVILWDLDNKPPKGPPYEAAMALKQVAQYFGHIVDISAYANRHAFIHLPQWVRDQRSQRRQHDILERKGIITPSQPYVCNVCGRKCKTNIDLRKHFKQLHERERDKKLNRMRSLKGKKRQKYKERFISGNTKYEDAARSLLSPKVGYGLASELRRAGVFVKMVEDKPQSADWALKRQMQHSMTRGIDWMFLVTDDSDFSDMLRRARESNLQTVVVGDSDRALGRHADLWVPWIGVQNGEIGEEDLFSARTRKEEFSHLDEDDGLFSLTEFDDSDYESGADQIVDGLGFSNSGVRISAFSEGEEEEIWVGDDFANDDTDVRSGKLSQPLVEKDLLWDSDEEIDEEDDFWETGASVDKVGLFRATHTSKKRDGNFIDNASREAAEKMVAIVAQSTNEGLSSLDTRQIITQVLGSGTKGRQRMMGTTIPKAEEKLLTEPDIRIVQMET